MDTSRAPKPPSSAIRGGFVLLLFLLFGSEALRPAGMFYRWDSLIYTFPLQREILSQWMRGILPGWFDGALCGTPLLANMNAGALYPLKLLWIPFAFQTGYKLYLLLHLALALWGMWRFFRALNLHSAAATCGAFAFVFGGFARSLWDTHHFAAWAWIPWALLAALEISRRQRRGVFLSALSLAMMLLAGDPQLFIMACAASLLIVLVAESRLQTLPLWFGGLGLALLFSAPQWLPTLLHFPETLRAGSLDAALVTERSFHPLRLLDLWIPYAFGTHEKWYTPGLFGAGATRLTPWTASLAVGPLFFAALFWIRRQQLTRTSLAVLAVGGIGLLLSFGRFLPGFHLFTALPLMGSFRYPEKYLVWFSVALSLGLALGIDALLRGKMQPRRGYLWALGLCLSAACVYRFWIGDHLGIPSSYQNRVLFWAVLGALPLALWFLPRFRRSPHGLLLGVALGLWTSWQQERPLESLPNALEVPPPMAQAVLASPPEASGRFYADLSQGGLPRPPWISGLPQERANQLTATFALAFNTPWNWGIRSASGFSPLESARMQTFRDRLGGAVFQPNTNDETFALFLRESAVSHLFTSETRWNALESQGLAGRVFVRWPWPNQAASVLVHLDNTSPLQILTQTENPPVLRRFWRQNPGRFKVDLQPGDAVRIQVSESYSRGWEAQTEQGQRLIPTVSEHGWMWIDVPARTRQLRFAYSVRGWREGCLLFVLGVLISLFVFQRGKTIPLEKFVRPLPVVTLSLLLYFGLGVAARNHWSPTYDEGFHLSRGLRFLQSGDARLNYNHPPLQNLLCALPVWLHGEGGVRRALETSTTDDALSGAVRYAYARGPAFRNDVRMARWGSQLLGLLLCGVLVAGTHARWGWKAAGLCGIAFALHPSLLSHGNLATTDMGLACFAALGTLLSWTAFTRNRPGLLHLGGVCFVLASLVKFSGLIWLGTHVILVLPLAAWRWKQSRFLWGIPLCLVLLYAACALFYPPGAVSGVIADRVPAALLDLPGGGYIAGWLSQKGYVLEGRRAFVAGTLYPQGQFWHLPLSWLLKTPPLWVLASLGGLLVSLRKPSWTWLAFLPALVFTAGLISVGKLTLGVRHLLPISALLIPLGVWGWSRIPHPQLRRIAAALLIVQSLGSLAGSYPSLLSYFPLWAGGMDSGHEWLVDSDYDWGQDLEKAEAVSALMPGVPFQYFGFSDPRAVYGMDLPPGSVGGFMDFRNALDSGNVAAWRTAAASVSGPRIASISFLRLHPYGIPAQSVDLHNAIRLSPSLWLIDSDAPPNP